MMLVNEIALLNSPRRYQRGCDRRVVRLARREQFIQKFKQKARKDETTYAT
jgi:hypothetical protein